MIRIQSILRGYQVWKQYAVQAPKGVFDDTIDINTLLHNKVVNSVRAEAGPFNYDACTTDALKLGPDTISGLVKKVPFRIEEGPVYLG